MVQCHPLDTSLLSFPPGSPPFTPPPLPTLQVDVSHVWISLSSICLAFVFVFGNSVRTLYESVLFLFVVHSFDVGDTIQLTSIPNDSFKV